MLSLAKETLGQFQRWAVSIPRSLENDYGAHIPLADIGRVLLNKLTTIDENLTSFHGERGDRKLGSFPGINFKADPFNAHSAGLDRQRRPGPGRHRAVVFEPARG